MQDAGIRIPSMFEQPPYLFQGCHGDIKEVHQTCRRGAHQRPPGALCLATQLTGRWGGLLWLVLTLLGAGFPRNSTSS